MLIKLTVLLSLLLSQSLLAQSRDQIQLSLPNANSFIHISIIDIENDRALMQNAKFPLMAPININKVANTLMPSPLTPESFNHFQISQLINELLNENFDEIDRSNLRLVVWGSGAFALYVLTQEAIESLSETLGIPLLKRA